MLSGGGSLGALQVGMLRALLERSIVPTTVVGCSVGAINGVGIAGDPSLRGVRRLEQLWHRVDEFDVMPSSLLPQPVQLARRGPSIHDNAGLRRLIEFGLHVDTFEELPLPFACVATDIDTADERWFDRGPLVPAILASAALPTVFPPVSIDGHRYLDGGIVNDIPLARAVASGAARIYVLHVGFGAPPLSEARRPIDVARWTYWAARRARYRRERTQVPPKVKVVELSPPERPSVRFDDFTRSVELVGIGYDAAVAMLEGGEARSGMPGDAS